MGTLKVKGKGKEEDTSSSSFHPTRTPSSLFPSLLFSSLHPTTLPLPPVKLASTVAQLGLVGLLTRPVIKAIFPSEHQVSTVDPNLTSATHPTLPASSASSSEEINKLSDRYSSPTSPGRPTSTFFGVADSSALGQDQDQVIARDLNINEKPAVHPAVLNLAPPIGTTSVHSAPSVYSVDNMENQNNSTQHHAGLEETALHHHTGETGLPHSDEHRTGGLEHSDALNHDGEFDQSTTQHTTGATGIEDKVEQLNLNINEQLEHEGVTAPQVHEKVYVEGEETGHNHSGLDETHLLNGGASAHHDHELEREPSVLGDEPNGLTKSQTRETSVFDRDGDAETHSEAPTRPT
jgi:hypothetical protein